MLRVWSMSRLKKSNSVSQDMMNYSVALSFCDKFKEPYAVFHMHRHVMEHSLLPVTWTSQKWAEPWFNLVMWLGSTWSAEWSRFHTYWLPSWHFGIIDPQLFAILSTPNKINISGNGLAIELDSTPSNCCVGCVVWILSTGVTPYLQKSWWSSSFVDVYLSTLFTLSSS